MRQASTGMGKLGTNNTSKHFFNSTAQKSKGRGDRLS